MPKENKPLTTEELEALANGARVFVVVLQYGKENLNHTYTCWRTIERNDKNPKLTKLKRKGGFGTIQECNRDDKSTSYHVYLEMPEGAVDSGK